MAKTILLFGAGKSSAILIDYLITEAIANNWKIIIADNDKDQILSKTNNSSFVEAIQIDITDNEKRFKLIAKADIIISLMPAALHFLIATDCVENNKNLLTASYIDDRLKKLQPEIEKKGLLFICELGLDPGIDHMSAMQLIDSIKKEGGVITSFKSHCGGLVAPENDNSPWRYKISWNPRNVVMAVKRGSIYKADGNIINEKYEELFEPQRGIKFPGLGFLSYYPNRNSLEYISLYKLQEINTFLRTTLRYPDFIYGWKNLIELKLTDEKEEYETDGLSLQYFFKQHLEKNGFGNWLQNNLNERLSKTRVLLENLMKLIETERAAKQEGQNIPENFMLVDEEGGLKDMGIEEIKNKATAAVANQMHEANLTLNQLFYLGMDDNETMINKGRCSAADVLQFALEKKLALQPEDKDMIVMLHEIDYIKDGIKRHVESSLVVYGENNLRTAMAKTVGLPLGITAKLILNGSIQLTGLHIPVIKEIYEPVLTELKKFGITFSENNNASK